MKFFNRSRFVILQYISFGVASSTKENKPENNAVLRCVDCNARITPSGRIIDSSESERSSDSDQYMQKEYGIPGNRVAGCNGKMLRCLLPWSNRNKKRNRIYIRKRFPNALKNQNSCLDVDKIEGNYRILSDSSGSDEIEFKVLNDDASTKKRIVISTPLASRNEQELMNFCDPNDDLLIAKISLSQPNCMFTQTSTETENDSIDSKVGIHKHEKHFSESKNTGIEANMLATNEPKNNHTEKLCFKGDDKASLEVVEIHKPVLAENNSVSSTFKYTEDSNESLKKKKHVFKDSSEISKNDSDNISEKNDTVVPEIFSDISSDAQSYETRVIQSTLESNDTESFHSAHNSSLDNDASQPIVSKGFNSATKTKKNYQKINSTQIEDLPIEIPSIDLTPLEYQEINFENTSKPLEGATGTDFLGRNSLVTDHFQPLKTENIIPVINSQTPLYNSQYTQTSPSAILLECKDPRCKLFITESRNFIAKTVKQLHEIRKTISNSDSDGLKINNDQNSSMDDILAKRRRIN